MKSPFDSSLSQESPSFTKAGAVIHGYLLEPKKLKGERLTIQVPKKHALIVPYTQGRFYDEQHQYLTANMGEDGILRDDMKYYSLPKGGIDPGENVIDAAIRETKEETDIDLNRMFCATAKELEAYTKHGTIPFAMERFKCGEIVEHFESYGYPGVRVVHADPLPFEHTYHTRASTKDKPVTARMAMFDIEVDGLEKLKDHLKNQDNIDLPIPGFTNDNRVDTTVDQMIDEANKESSSADNLLKYLPFETYLGWLRLGVIPPDGLQFDNAARDARHQHMYQLLDGEKKKHFADEPPRHEEWFLQLERDYAPNGMIHSRGDWQKFCRDVPKPEYSKLRHCFKAVKDYAKGRGCLNSDCDVIKMDDKDNPLFYYQEGADIVSFERFFSHVGIMAEANNDYRRAFTGDCEALQRHSRPEQVAHSQVAGIAAFADERDIKRGIQRFRATVGNVIPQLQRTARNDPEFDLDVPLLQVRDAQLDRHELLVEQQQAGLSRLSP